MEIFDSEQPVFSNTPAGVKAAMEYGRRNNVDYYPLVDWWDERTKYTDDATDMAILAVCVAVIVDGVPIDMDSLTALDNQLRARNIGSVPMQVCSYSGTTVPVPHYKGEPTIQNEEYINRPA